MTDLAIVFTDAGGDLVLSGGDLVKDEGLQAAVTVSLYSDGRARDEVLAPLGMTDPRGCWWDLPDFRWGSLLWLLGREKQTEEVRVQAREYAQNALQWMITEGIASSVSVRSAWVRTGVLCLEVELTRGASRRWDHLWKGLTIFQAQFGGFATDGGTGVSYSLHYGTALAPTGSPLNFGTAASPTGPAINLGGA